MNIFILGIGLIGGSLAKDLKRLKPDYNFFGIDKNKHHLLEAINLGLVDQSATYDDLSKADLVFLTIPVDEIIKELPSILDKVKDDCLVIDCGSTKSLICKAVEKHPKRRNFLASHPIAGTEFSGPTAALEGLYDSKTNIICEVEKTAFKLQEIALELFHLLGMRIRYMNPDAHDKHIAYVSHLSHISSFMLGKTVIAKEENERDIFDMAGSGFESTVRLAKSSPSMWAPIFKQNKVYILNALEEYIRNLEEFKHMLSEDDYQGTFEVMKKTNRIKEILKGLPSKQKIK